MKRRASGFGGNQFGQHDPMARFWAKVDKRGPDECWPWTAGLASTGYGAFGVGKRYISAHCFAYEAANGPVMAGWTVDHDCHTRDKNCPGGVCRHRLCVNPAHLVAMPRGRNTLLGKTRPAENVLKTECPNGHPYDEANTYWYGRSRACRICHANRERERQRRKARERSGLPAHSE
jgi:hypothetical protein